MREAGSVKLRPAGCPRHLDFHPSGKFAYLAEEYSNHVVVLACNPQTGGAVPIQRLPTEPDCFMGLYAKASEIKVHPSGRFLYVSNRGSNSIAVYGINQETGLLTPQGWTGCNGEVPRFFMLGRTGKYLLCGNQKSHQISVFSINQDTGALSLEKEIKDISCPAWMLLSEDEKQG